MRKTYRCARCGIAVTPANWFRLVTGVLLCGRCGWKSEAAKFAEAAR